MHITVKTTELKGAFDALGKLIGTHVDGVPLEVKIGPLGVTFGLRSNVRGDVDWYKGHASMSAATTVTTGSTELRIAEPKVVFDFVRRMSDDMVDFDCTDNAAGVTITSGKDSITVRQKRACDDGALDPKDEWTDPVETVHIDRDDFVRMIDATKYAVCRKECYVPILGIRLTSHLEDGYVEAVGTDGYRIGIYRAQAAGTMTKPMTLPLGLARRAQKVFPKGTAVSIGRLKDGTGYIEGNNGLRFLFKDANGGEFIDYTSFVPNATKHPGMVSIPVPRKKLLDAATQVVKAAKGTKDASQPCMFFFFDGDEIDIRFWRRDETIGSSKIGTIETVYQNNPFYIVFNAHFIVDPLKNIRDRTVLLKFRDTNPLTPVLITGRKDQNTVKCVALPIHIEPSSLPNDVKTA